MGSQPEHAGIYRRGNTEATSQQGWQHTTLKALILKFPGKFLDKQETIHFPQRIQSNAVITAIQSSSMAV